MKFCKDCKYARVSLIDRILFNYEFAKCENPELRERVGGYVDPATGKSYPESSSSSYCSTMRIKRCGQDAKYFEPRG